MQLKLFTLKRTIWMFLVVASGPLFVCLNQNLRKQCISLQIFFLHIMPFFNLNWRYDPNHMSTYFEKVSMLCYLCRVCSHTHINMFSSLKHGTITILTAVVCYDLLIVKRQIAACLLYSWKLW